MAEDMRDTFYEAKKALEKILSEDKLSLNERKIILTAMNFGYTAAFCSRTCDLNGSFLAAQEYDDGYKQVREKIPKK